MVCKPRLIFTRLLVGATVLATGWVVGAPAAQALPWNEDMVKSELLRKGSIMRPRAEGSVSRVADPSLVQSKEEAKVLPNPVEPTESSVLRGQRLFRTNCYPCHGDITAPGYASGPVGKFLGAANIVDARVRAMTDGWIYGTIEFGGMAIMPALGWKIPSVDKWHIINYLRFVQAEVAKREAAAGTPTQ